MRRRVPYWGWGLALAVIVWNPVLLWQDWHGHASDPGGYVWPALATFAVAVVLGNLAEAARRRRVARGDQEQEAGR